MVEISRRDYLAATATVAMGSRAVDTAEARQDKTRSVVSRPNTDLGLTCAALHLRDVEWSEVPGISAEEADEFASRMMEAADELMGDSDE